MNIPFHPTAPLFGAVFKKKPANEETLFFQHDSEKSGMPERFYATGEDKAALQPLNDNINNATTVYSHIKTDFLVKSGYCDEEQAILCVAASTGNIHSEAFNVKRNEQDDKLLARYGDNLLGHLFKATRGLYENAVAQYLAKTAELAQKAQ